MALNNLKFDLLKRVSNTELIMMMKKRTPFLLLFGALLSFTSFAQNFYFGADLSYVNEMQDCGVTYSEKDTAKDPYALFADHDCNLVRLRLWHTPDWYDELNDGKRYSDLRDVKKSIQRAKEQGMGVLLDFHLSDNWADPGKQVAPKAWQPVVNDLPVLSDSLYNYIYNTLDELRRENLLPEMIQIGNETNRGILLSPEQNEAGWVLDWERNATLFNRAIQAVRELEQAHDLSIGIMLHIAGPDDAPWFIDRFVANGVTDFDFIGLSYYWQWHNSVDLDGVGEVIHNFRATYPDYQVMIVETGYPWTSDFNDAAGNILGMAHPEYQPLSPDNQAEFLIALTEQVMENGGAGVVYWEPAWVSSSCSTQWGTGSHYEHAAFFDFQNKLLTNGGIRWMTHDYTQLTNSDEPLLSGIHAYWDESGHRLVVESEQMFGNAWLEVFTIDGRIQLRANLSSISQEFILSEKTTGVYLIHVVADKKSWSKKIFIP